jgi:hypothetical protein
MLYLKNSDFMAKDSEKSILPIVMGKPESCLKCHSGMTGFSAGHEPVNIGCFSCHGGNPLDTDKLRSHEGMRMVPGNLSNASESCGSVSCHPFTVNRVQSSLMAKLSGMISVDKWVFGETALPEGYEKITDIGHSPAETHLRNLCAGCHLGNEKTHTGKAEWLERGGGCLACHLNYNEKAITSLDQLKRQSANDTTPPAFHPAIDLNITNDRCMSCHSRSGRISLNYEGWAETMLKPEEVTGKSAYRILPDDRVFEKKPADIHHEKGMLCIDCHGSYELMGDGNLYAHKEEAVKVQCSDCHTKDHINSKLYTETGSEAQLIAWARKYKTENIRIVVTQKSGMPLVNTLVDEDGKGLRLIKKLNSDTVLSKPSAGICTEGLSHDHLSCESCHSAWVSQCIGCHNSYELDTQGFDMLTVSERKGTWLEYASAGLAEPPVLGMRKNESSSWTVGTFAPGMIMQIEHNFPNAEKGKTFHRLYAPVSSHTTMKEGRACKSCHSNSLAIGYGRGILSFSSSGLWSFEPEYQNNMIDQLPEDAWIGFLKERTDLASTRLDMRPFSIIEQQKILTVGACLTCHDEKSKVMQTSLSDFEMLIQRRSPKCVMPVW